MTSKAPPAVVASLQAALTDAQLEELESLFQVFDVKSTPGGINRMSCSDLAVAFQMLGTQLTREQVQAFITLYSADGKHFSKEEFLEIAGEVLLAKPDDEKVKMLEDAYHLFDLHGSGSVSAKQLHRVLVQLNHATNLAEAGDLADISEEDLEDLVRDLDTDGLGITKHMFVDMLKVSPSIL